jgi:ABC-type multidrug transport system ATPase subunit
LDKIIEVTELKKNYGSFCAVKNINMHVMAGDCYGFLGPNGAGKSTTIRMLTGLINPTCGSIRIFGLPLNQNKQTILRSVGAIVEKPDFYNYLSASKNLMLLSKISGQPISQKRIDELFELVGLQGRQHDKVKAYSHGMKQRLGIAQALLNNPDLILLDEPTTGLDPQGIIDVRNLINHLRQQGKTILLSSHILSEIELISNRMIIINKGVSVIEGNVVDLMSGKELDVTIEVDDPQSALQFLQHSAFASSVRNCSGLHIGLNISKEAITDVNKFLIENKIGVFEISFKRPLESYFLKLTAGSAA